MPRPTPRDLPPAPADHATPPVKGLLLMIAGVMCLPVLDTFAKLLTESVSAGEVAGIRFVVQTLLLAPLASALLGRRLWRPEKPLLQAMRGVLVAGATLLYFAALKEMALPDALAIFFVEPLILTALSALFLGEKVGWRRFSAVGVGLVGALVIIGPQFQQVGTTALLPLGTAICFAAYIALTRQLGGRTGAVAMQFYAGVAGAVVMAVALGLGHAAGIEALTLSWPSGRDWGLILGLGVAATAAHLLIVAALKHAAASLLAPFQYLEVVSATLLGLFVFGDFPRPYVWLGMALIIGSGLFVFWRERRLARRG
ncbi:DMT family transporter [Roseospirillum parvum]|uniref:Threonine/homoserine efflux transporter RhtA n=1 Tax=Roseospirillum parvum TaxID=83401 RepID=A0A1G7V433_9PROT|nr:DMT family transporter [Roseospirillum parvum]SDG54487.1 Threonine/homoserine efflux transporter RhtA [Roseospirillum parvum]